MDGTRYLVTKISTKSLVLFLKYVVIFVVLQKSLQKKNDPQMLLLC